MELRKCLLLLVLFVLLTACTVFAKDPSSESDVTVTHDQLDNTPVQNNVPQHSPIQACANDTNNASATCHNDKDGTDVDVHGSGIFSNLDSGMMMRSFYVLLGVTSIVVLYFVVRAVRLRRRRSKSKKYGLLTTQASDLEMQPLDQEDEEDEITMYEVNGKPK